MANDGKLADSSLEKAARARQVLEAFIRSGDTTIKGIYSSAAGTA